MQSCSSKPNAVTLVSLLSGCATVGALLYRKETHCYVIRYSDVFLGVDGNDLEDDLMVINALIDMYSKCKIVNVAHAMFDAIAPNDRNVLRYQYESAFLFVDNCFVDM
ncbi:hypothetical protein Dsin_007486 [Dipteronia sinensis]|uniref:Uncharacterized protein n=1 Tax=Dipteronia sinensis TaxID=43782 RepID=A0AAE0B1L2_9ROSI|nr:hypothetical protein Dsin_007486 [Dipteronia sinensis]